MPSIENPYIKMNPTLEAAKLTATRKGSSLVEQYAVEDTRKEYERERQLALSQMQQPQQLYLNQMQQPEVPPINGGFNV